MLQTLLCQYEDELTAFYSVSSSVRALSLSPPLSSSSCHCCHRHTLLPHCPLHIPSPTSGIFIAHKVNLMEKCVSKRAVKPGTRADGGKGGDAWPVPSSPGVPCTPNYANQGQWRQGRAQSPALLAPHPPVSIHPW